MDSVKVDRGMLHILHMLKVFQRHVARVCFECFRCFRGMFHLCFPDACCNYVYLDVAYVSHICCMCFIWMLRMVAMVFKCVSGVFSSVSEACFKCFNCLQTYVAVVVFGCFKSRSDVASLLPTPSAASSQGIHSTSWPGPSESEAPRTFPLLSLGRRGPCVERETEYSVRISGR